MDFIVECHYSRWVFRPCTPKAVRWLENNLYPARLEIDRPLGPCVVRAIHAEGLKTDIRAEV